MIDAKHAFESESLISRAQRNMQKVKKGIIKIYIMPQTSLECSKTHPQHPLEI